MKFTNGFWLEKDGIVGNYAAHVYEVEQKDNQLIVYAPVRYVATRGNTLSMPLLTVRYSAPLKDVLKISITHFEGEVDKAPHYEIFSDNEIIPKINIDEKEAVIESGALSAHISLGSNWLVQFYGNGKKLTKNEWKSTAFMRETTEPIQHLFYSGEKTYIKDELSLAVGENVYGFGERFGAFVKNGQSIETSNQDGGTAGEQSYKTVPFYLTNNGYGVFVNSCDNVSFEVATEKVARVQFSVPGEKLEYFIIYGPSPKEIIKKYTDLTGKPAMIPEWSLGLWLSTSFTTSYDEKTVMSFIDGMNERNIPLSVFHFDCFWMKGFNWCDFTWDSKTFPDPKGLIERLHKRNLKVCVWINPYIAQRSPLFEEGIKAGYFIKKSDGSVWQTDMWQAGMAIVDFTNPEACRWYESKLEALIDMGVDSFKTDFGERIPTDCVYFNNADPEKMHNYYTYLYNKCVFELLERKYGKGEACLFARSATAGSQKFPLHWGGDCESTFEAMAETLRGGLSLGLCGFGFWSHDIGGFEGNPPPSLFKRWLQFGLLSSHSRLHGSNSYRVPWSVDEESSEVARIFTNIKNELKPYLLEMSKESCKTGVPVLRAMFLEFEDDPTCVFLDRQYMLGDSLLVAPIFTEDNSVEYYLPQGIWTHFIDGRKIDCSAGGRWLKETYDFTSLPLWKKSGGKL